MNQSLRKVWTFASDSNPDREYQTLQYADLSTSCNCPGWTRRIGSDGQRSCKHTRYVDLGSADRHCTASKDYTTHLNPQTQTSTKGSRTHGQNKVTAKPRLGERKFAL